MDREPDVAKSLRGMLIANTVIELACGSVLLFAPRLLSGNDKTLEQHEALWRGGEAIVTFGRACCGCALLSLGVLSWHAVASFPKPPPVSMLSCLSFYHCAASIVVVPMTAWNKLELQLPAAVIHPILGLGFAYHAMFGLEQL